MKDLLINEAVSPAESKAEQDFEKTQEELSSLDLTECDLSPHDISLTDCNTGVFASSQSRWVNYLFLHHHLQKLLLFFILDEQCLTQEVVSQKSSCCKGIWISGLSLPIQSTSHLRKIYSWNGFRLAISQWISRVWSGLLTSFLVYDLYFYYRGSDACYDMNLVTIFLTRSRYEKSLTASLVSPEVWPELFLLPLCWGLIKGMREGCRAKPLTADEIEVYLDRLVYYEPGWWRDLFSWIFPINTFKDTLDVIQRALLWDNRLTVQQRKNLLKALQIYFGKAKKFSYFYGLSIFGSLCRQPSSADLKKIQAQNVPKNKIAAIFAARVKSLIELQKLVTDSQNKVCLFPNYLITNYIFWLSGVSTPALLQPLFWVYCLVQNYFKIKFFYTAYQGLLELIHRYLDKKECEEQGKRWLYIENAGDYICSVCGDLPIYYSDIFDVKHCLASYSRFPRNVSDLIKVYQSLDLNEVESIDLSYQQFSDSELSQVLAVIFRRACHVKQLYLNLSAAHVGPSSLGVVVENFSNLELLSLRNQQIGLNGTLALTAVLQRSRLKFLDLGYNYIQAQGARVLASVLPGSSVQELDLFACMIQDAGAQSLGKVINKSQLKKLYLGVNNIGDSGLEFLAEGLKYSLLEELDLWGNIFCEAGMRALGEAMPYSVIKRLIVRSNPCIGSAGMTGFARNISNSTLEDLSCGYVGMGDDGLAALALQISKSKITNLNLRSNFITPPGFAYLSKTIMQSRLKILDLSFNAFDSTSIRELAESVVNSEIDDLILEGLQFNDADFVLLKPVVARLRGLYVANNAVTNEGMKVFSPSLSNSGLQVLDLSDNLIEDEGAIYLGDALSNSSLVELSLATNKIQARGASALAKGLVMSDVQRFIFYSNVIGPEGSSAFATALPKTKLRQLNLAGCEVNDPVLILLSQQLPYSSLEVLELGYNEIQDNGAIALANILTIPPYKIRQDWVDEIDTDTKKVLAAARSNTHLKKLSLQGNKIGSAGAKFLCLVLPQTQIDFLQFKLTDNPIDINEVNINTCQVSAAAATVPRSPYQWLYKIYAAMLPSKVFMAVKNFAELPPPSSKTISKPTNYLEVSILLLYLAVIVGLVYRLLRCSNHQNPLSFFFAAAKPAENKLGVCSKSLRHGF